MKSSVVLHRGVSYKLTLPLLVVLIGVLGLGLINNERRPRRDLVLAGATLNEVQYRGLSRQELVYRLPERGGLAKLHRHLVWQGWQLDASTPRAEMHVYRRRLLGGLVYESVLVTRKGELVQLGVMRCLRWVGCG